MVSTNEKQTNRKNSFSYELYYLSEKFLFVMPIAVNS